MSAPAKYLMDYKQFLATLYNMNTGEKVDVIYVPFVNSKGESKPGLGPIYLVRVSEDKRKKLLGLQNKRGFFFNINKTDGDDMSRVIVSNVPANDRGLEILAEIDDIFGFQKYEPDPPGGCGTG